MAEARTERLLDEMEIKSLIVRERYYRDTQQWAKLRQSYHSDASKTHIKISWYNGDIDGFVAGSERMAKGAASTSHSVCPVEVHLRGDKAVSESTGAIYARFKFDGVEYDITSFGRFVSRLARDGAEWKLCSLEVIYDRDALQPVIPGNAAKAVQLDSKARDSYKCLSWVLAQNGLTIDQELPGTDRPGSGEALMKHCFDWLNNGT